MRHKIPFCYLRKKLEFLQRQSCRHGRHQSNLPKKFDTPRENFFTLAFTSTARLILKLSRKNWRGDSCGMRSEQKRSELKKRGYEAAFAFMLSRECVEVAILWSCMRKTQPKTSTTHFFLTIDFYLQGIYHLPSAIMDN